jgi:hypothetical protein
MKKLLLLIPALLLLGYLTWSNLDRQELDLPTDAQFRDYQTIGIDSGRGNLIGIQPFMVTADYSSEKAFYKKWMAISLNSNSTIGSITKVLLCFPNIWARGW